MYLPCHVKPRNHPDLVVVCLVPRLTQSKGTNKLLDSSSCHLQKAGWRPDRDFSKRNARGCVGRLISLQASKHFVSLLYSAPPSVLPLLEPCSASRLSVSLQELLETSLFRNARILKVHFHFLRNKHYSC